MENSPNSLQRCSTALNVLMEKFTLQSRYLRSGSCTRRVLCIGVKWRIVSAWTPHWSSVERVRVSQQLRDGHQRAWSDQSMAISGGKEKKEDLLFQDLREGNNILTFLNLGKLEINSNDSMSVRKKPNRYLSHLTVTVTHCYSERIVLWAPICGMHKMILLPAGWIALFL